MNFKGFDTALLFLQYFHEVELILISFCKGINHGLEKKMVHLLFSS